MKKLFLSAVLLLMLSTAVYGADVSVRLNHSGDCLEARAIAKEGEIYLPLQDICSATGERLRHSATDDMAYVIRDGEEVVCFYAVQPAEDFKSEQCEAENINGKIYITPQSYVQIFGGSINWNKSENVVEITQRDYNFGVEEIKLFRPAETVMKKDKEGNVYLEICESYTEIMPLKNGAGEYVKEVEVGRIPVISLLKTHYGIDYSVTQAFTKRPTATVKLTRGDETCVYTIHFKESF